MVAHSRPGASWLAEGCIDSADEVLDLDWAAFAAGDPSAFGFLERTDRPHCRSARTARVTCAARRSAAPLPQRHGPQHPEQVWEVTHTSGHRFAPTAVLLPFGTLHGRLTAEAAIDLLSVAGEGRTALARIRGRSCWPAAGQVAEIAVREQTGELDLDALTVAGDGDSWTVDHTDGRTWLVTTAVEDTGLARAESCLKGLVPLSYVAADVRPAARR